MNKPCLFIVSVYMAFVIQVQSAETVVRAEVIPKTAWIGQRVTLRIDVLAKDAWAQVKSFDDLTVPGAIVMQTESQGVRLQETINGDAYTGQRYELSVYPQRSGSLALDPLPLRITSRTWGADAQEVTEETATPRLTLDVRVPDGAESLTGVISTSRLTVEERWEPSLNDHYNVGDALSRRIHIEAVDVSGMAVTPAQPPELAGVSVYLSEADVKDVSNRGELTGSRTEIMTYVFEQPGSIQLPAMEYHWFDTKNEDIKTIVLQAQTLIITGQVASLPADSLAEASSTSEEISLIGWIITGGASVLMLVFLLPFTRDRLHQWRSVYQDSERIHFRRIMDAAKKGDSHDAQRAVMAWLDNLPGIQQPARYDEFMAKYGVTPENNDLTQILADDQDGMIVFIKEIAAARRCWKKSLHKQRIAEKILPPLNP